MLTPLSLCHTVSRYFYRGISAISEAPLVAQNCVLGRMMILVALVTLVAAAAATTPPPNVLILLTDDQGWGDTEYNCENSTGLCAHTPNLAELARSKNTALFHRFYSAASVCSPTRAALLTGRTNNRDCIDTALPCCNEDPAPTCSMGKRGALPWTEFTVAKAAKKSKLGDYATIHLGKVRAARRDAIAAPLTCQRSSPVYSSICKQWHLGDLWDKHLPGMSPEKWSVSSPGDAGFDEWLSTQAEASNSMPNCGCYPVNHTSPGPKPPAGYSKISPHGDQCVVGGGAPSDWCYPCTNYYYPNASDARLVTDLQERVPGDDSAFLVDRFDAFLLRQLAARRPWLAHLCFHASGHHAGSNPRLAAPATPNCVFAPFCGQSTSRTRRCRSTTTCTRVIQTISVH